MQKKLIKLRKNANITQEQMAEMIGISKSAYWRKETGRKDFNETEMFDLRNIFRLPMEQIFLPKKCIDNAETAAAE